MVASNRALTLEDIEEVAKLSAKRAEAGDVYRLVERISAETMGWRLFTILRYVEAEASSSASIRATPGPIPWEAASS